jgi:hypothetical protein
MVAILERLFGSYVNWLDSVRRYDDLFCCAHPLPNRRICCHDSNWDCHILVGVKNEDGQLHVEVDPLRSNDREWVNYLLCSFFGSSAKFLQTPRGARRLVAELMMRLARNVIGEGCQYRKII